MKLLTTILLISNLLLLPSISNSQKILQLAVDGETAVVNTGKTLALVTEKGNVFTKITTPSLLQSEKLILDISGNTIVAFYGHYGHISLDKGATWKEFKIPEKEVKIHSVNIYESTIFVGANSGLYYSNNNGETWEKASGIKKAKIHSMAKSSTTLYAGGKETEYGVPLFYISTDNGKSWEKFNKDIDGGDISHIATDGNTVLVSTVNYVSSKNYGVYSLNKELQKWDMIADEKLFERAQITGIAISDTNYVISGGQNYLVSNNKGKTWNKVNLKIPNTDFKFGIQLFSSLIVPDTKNGILYTLTNSGHMFQSVDNGANWEKVKWQADSEKAAADEAEAKKNLENAKLAKQKRYRDSVATVAEFRKANEKSLKNYFRGIGELSYSNYDSALVKFNKAILAKPDFTEAYMAREKCYRAMNQTENAKNDSITLAGLTASPKANPEFDAYFKSLEAESILVGSVLYTECYYKDANGWYLRAKKDYSSENQLKFMWKAVELDDTKVEYWIFLGDISRDKLYDVAAETHYKRAIKLNPNCQWYDFERTRALTCGNCNGKGYRLQVNITQQKVNNTTHSTSDSERIACTQCKEGYVITKEKFPSVKLVK